MNKPNHQWTTDEYIAERVREILISEQCYGEESAITNEKILEIISRTEGLPVDERRLRRAYSEHLAVCTSARGVFLPASKEDRAVFKNYLETKVRTQAIHAAKRLKRLDEAFPEFAPERPAKDTFIQFELDLDKIG